MEKQDNLIILLLKLTRNSIDILKDHFRKDLTKSDWDLVRTLKTFFEII